jgi:ribulose-5-phosphate 4-epimerase/fuculose-1-phosphate aldolase
MPADARKTLLDDLVAAYRILADRGVIDGFGHVSARDPEHPDRYLLARSMPPSAVAHDDLMTFDLASNPIEGDPRRPFLERFIHGAIYARRPDVHAVVHSHAQAVIPFAVSSVPFRPVHHVSGFLGFPTPVFEIRERFGSATDMLVRSVAHGDALADALGAHAVVLMRGHGYCAVGPSVPVAVYRAIYTIGNAAIQKDAIALGGEVRYLEPAEAAAADAVHVEGVMRPWTLWKSRVRTDDDD